MSKYPKNRQCVEYYVVGKKRRVSWSTKATNDFIVIVHNENMNATISELCDIIKDKNQYITNPEAIRVLEDHISAGYGRCVPSWK